VSLAHPPGSMHLCVKHQAAPPPAVFPRDDAPPAHTEGLAIRSLLDADVLVYHDPCHDGRMAAALAYGANPALKLIGIAPHQLAKGVLDEELKGKRVVFCDLCPAGLTSDQQLVLDHHPRAGESVAGHGWSAQQVVFDTTRSGAALMWWFITGSNIKLPHLVRAIDLYDRGLFEQAPDAVGYHMALDDTPCPACYLEHMNDPSALITEEIRVKLRARQALLNATMGRAVEGTIHGTRVWLFADTPYNLVNEIGRLHLLAYSARAPGVAAFTRYNETEGRTAFSFRSVDGESARALALKMGGDGHGDAAGAGIDGRDISQVFTPIDVAIAAAPLAAQ